MEGHKQMITNKAETVTAPVKILKQLRHRLENITNLINCPQENSLSSKVSSPTALMTSTVTN